MSETVGFTAEHAKVTFLTVLMVGGIGVAGYFTAGRPPAKAVPVAAAPAQPAGEFGLSAYGTPRILDCDTPHTTLRLAYVPERTPQTVVIGAKKHGVVTDAARVQIGPPISDVGYADWHGEGSDLIAIDEYQTPRGAVRNLGTIANILVQADSQAAINVTATCS